MVTKSGFREVHEAEARSHWDGWLSRFRDASVRQSFAWAGYKRGGWRPRFFGLFDKNPRVLALALERRAPLGVARVAWINAGPVCGLGAAAEDLAALREFSASFCSFYGARAAVRAAPLTPWSEEAAAILASAGFAPAREALMSGVTSVLELSPSEESLRAGLDRKWRNQLKKAESFSPRFEFGRDDALLSRLHRLHEELCDRKGLAAERLPLAAFQKAARDFGPALTFAIGSVDGRDGCGMAWWNFAGRATLWVSAADDWGLSKNLPNALYWQAVLRLKSEGAQSFDLAGLDPVENPGVTHFKLGLGAGTLKTLGEWDWSRVPLTRRVFNLALGAVRSRMPR